MQSVIPARHLLLALAVVFVWGTNFVVIKLGLNALPPLLFATLRYTLAALPFMLLVRRPQVSWRNLAVYGVLIGVGQFGLLFIAMQRDISPGLASLVVQSQVFFTMGLAMALSGDRPRLFQLVASLVAAIGMVVIALKTDGSTTLLGLLLVTLAAISWAAGNIVNRSAALAQQAKGGEPLNMLAYVVWSSAFAVPPLFLLSLWFEGWPRIVLGVSQAGWDTWLAVLWQSYGNTIFGYGAWAWLLSRYAAASVSPMALLVPVFGMAASALLLGEGMPGWKLLAAGLVLLGLAINVLWPHLHRRWAR